MSQIKVFCEECREDVNFNIVEKMLESTIKGEKYSYLGKWHIVKIVILNFVLKKYMILI